MILQEVGKMHLFMILLLLVFGVFAEGSASQQVPYRTGFEPPLFQAGELGPSGQDGWVGNGYVQTATPTMIRSGAQSLAIEQTSIVTKPLTSPLNQKVYIDGYYHGPTVNSKPNPEFMDPGSSLILFHESEGILALNGDGVGMGTWVQTGVAVSPAGFQRITICQDYATHTWTLFINQNQVPLNSPMVFGFKDNTLNQLNGIDIETSGTGKGYLDDFSATTAVPDFFQEAVFDFSTEWQNETTMNPSNLNWDLKPETGAVDSNDLIELISRKLKGE
jgi:hypothetical protein